MKIIVEIEYEPCDENETFERTKEIVTGNIENCLGKVVSVKEVKEKNRFNSPNGQKKGNNYDCKTVKRTSFSNAG